MKNLAICITAFVLVSCGTAQKKNQDQESGNGIKSVKLELIWETDTVFQTPESVLADEARGVLYVANMNTGAAPNSGGGFISKVDMQGNIIDLKWAEGLNGPKGMGVFENFLYAADNNEVVKIDTESGEIIEKIQIEGRPGLNDITMGSDGSVYVSGYNSNVIYKVKDGTVETVFTGEAGENFNGLLWEEDRILLITSTGSTFKSIDWATKTATVIAQDLGHGDGIVHLGNGDYITSDWRGRIFYIPAEGEPITLLDTREQEINAADIDYVIESNMLFVPTFYKNSLKAFKVVIE
jgi:outer membrane protein assembly factor BamB